MRYFLLAILLLLCIYWRLCKGGGYPSEEGLDEIFEKEEDDV